MAKKSMIEREKKRQHLVDVYAAKRAALKVVIANQDLPVAERFAAAFAKTACQAIAAIVQFANGGFDAIDGVLR